MNQWVPAPPCNTSMQRRVGAMEGSVDHWVNVMAAPLAAVSLLAADAIKLTVLSTLGAVDLRTVPGFHQMRQAGVIIRKLLHKVHQCGDLELRGLSHRCLQ